MEEEIKNLKTSSGSTVCSESSDGVGLGGSSTFARPSLASRYHEMCIRRKMEFKGWITNCTRSSLQGITDDEVLKLVSDVEEMMFRHPSIWLQ